MAKGLTTLEIALMGILVAVGLIVSYHYGVSLYQKYVISHSSSSSLTYVKIPCTSYSSCESMLISSGISKEKIGELGLKCIGNDCYIKGYVEKVRVKK